MKNFTYNRKNIVMGKFDKIIKNVSKVIKVTGFYVTMPGDMSVGMFDQEWKVEGDFYFDNQDELDEFKALLDLTFQNHCGEQCLVETYEERQLQIDSELANQ